MPPLASSIHAERGTRCHEIGEQLLRNQIPAPLEGEEHFQELLEIAKKDLPGLCAPHPG